MWTEKSVGEILQLEYGKPLDKEYRKPDGQFPVYGANGEIDRTDRSFFEEPSIIVGRKGSAGELNLTEPKFWPLDVTYFIKFNSNENDLRFIYYLLTTLDLPKLAKGVKPGINRNEVYSIKVRVPSLAEQQRIVDVLDEAFETIATARDWAEKNLSNARALRESHLNAIFSQRGIGWMEKPLREICNLINGRAYKKSEMLKKGKYPLLRVGNFFTNKDWYYSDLELDPDKYCDHGDLLYAWSASFGPRIWEGGKVIYHYHIWKVLPNSDLVDKQFLRHLLLWDVEQIKRAHGTGTTMMHVSKGSMENRIVPIPPKNIQFKIVSLFDQLTLYTERLEAVYNRKLAALDELKRSLLHQAFNGKL